MAPGDVVAIKAGTIYNTDVAGAGALTITSSGTAAAPITITSYGSGDKPIINNTSAVAYSDAIDLKNAHYVTINGIAFGSATQAAVNIDTNSNHITVENSEMTNVGEGVLIKGTNNLITGNYIHDLNMVKNTPTNTASAATIAATSNDDYGATGVVISGSNNEVSDNRIINAKAASYDYGTDGGAVELFGSMTNISIHDNYVASSDGFLEAGGTNSTLSNIQVYNNVSYNNGNFLTLHNGAGTFASTFSNVLVHNNTVVDQNNSAKEMATIFLDAPATAAQINVYSNIFSLNDGDSVFKQQGNYHSNNLIFLQAKDTHLYNNWSMTLGPGEQYGDPKLTNVAAGNFTPMAAGLAQSTGAVIDVKMQAVISGTAADSVTLAVTPATPVIASFSPDSNIVGDSVTNANHITLAGSAAAGSTVEVFDGTTQIGTTTASASGAWSFTTATLADGSHAFTGMAVDAAGNVSAASVALNVTVDTVAPNAPTVASFSPDSNIVGDGVTNANHLTLAGSAAAGSTVEVFDGTTQIGTTTASASGAWSFTTATLADGSHAFTGMAMDAAGNVSAASVALNVTVDTVAPNAPTVASFLPDSNIVGDGVTNANHLTLAGSAIAGSTVEVFDGTTQIGTTTASASGAWSFATATLADGSHAFTGMAVDAAGNVSAASVALNVTVDTVAPNAPTVASFSPDSNIVGDGVTNANHLTLAGSAVAGSTVEVFDGTTQIGVATADVSGAWSFATGTLADGSHAFTGNAMDAAGNISTASAILAVTVDTVAPNAPNVISDVPASATSVIITGTAEAGSTVKLYEGTTLLGTGIADGSGTWNINSGSLSQGSHDFTATATDTAGNVSIISNILDPVIGFAIETSGSTSLIQAGNNFFFKSSDGSGPELKYAGTAVSAGQFGSWTLIGAEQTATGYEVAWKAAGVDKYTVWNTDSSGNYLSNSNTVTGSSSTLTSLESSFHQDLNGDGVIGTPSSVVAAAGNIVLALSHVAQEATIDTGAVDMSGSISLIETGNNFFLNGGSGSGPELKYAGAAVLAGQFGSWTPIGAEQTATGYEVVWKAADADKYTVWSTDSSGNYLSNSNTVTGSSATLTSLESSSHQDLNGDGVIGTPSSVIEATGNTLLTLSHMIQAATIDTGATLELAGADSGSVTFSGATGILVLDHSSSFTGKILNLTGDGNPLNSDQIDLKDVTFGSGTADSYSGNSSGGTLTIHDAQNHTTNLSLVGNYTNSTFTLSSDGHGGTLVIDPPKDNFNFAPASAGADGPTMPLVSVAGNDAFVFHQPAAANFQSTDSFAFEVAGPKLEGGAQSIHQGLFAGHDTGFDYADGLNSLNPHHAELPAGDFIMH